MTKMRDLWKIYIQNHNERVLFNNKLKEMFNKKKKQIQEMMTENQKKPKFEKMEIIPKSYKKKVFLVT